MTKNEMMKNEQMTIDSREVAEMIGKRHADVIRSIDGYNKILLNAKLRSVDFFIESSYKDASGKMNKCYQITKMGCEMVANKLTGKKGVLFTAAYVKKFNEMKNNAINKFNVPRTLSEALRLAADQQDKIVNQKRLIALKNREIKREHIGVVYQKRLRKKAEEELELQKPEVELIQKIKIQDHEISVKELADLLTSAFEVNIGRNELFKLLRRDHFLCSSGRLKNKPTRKSLSLGVMNYRINKIETGRGIIVTYTPTITGKGQIYFLKKMEKMLEEKVDE